MKRIFPFEVFDIIPSRNGIILSQKELYNGTSYKVSFLEYNVLNGKFSPVTKDYYQLNKFGEKYVEITEEIGDYITCEAAVFKNKTVAVVYPTGETGLFDRNGKNVWTGDLIYRDCPINSVVADANQFWTAVPLQNSIISYSLTQKKFSMRIGSENAPTFSEPVSLSLYGNELFVCNAGSNKIRKIDLNNYLASDYKQFEEPVYKYIRSALKEFVILSSGVYVI